MKEIIEKNIRKNKGIVIIAIVSLSITLWADTFITTCLADIYATFMNAGTFLQNYIVTGPYLASIPIILLIGKLADKFSKKNMVLIFILISAIGGVMGAFATNMLMLAIFRTLAGVSICVIGMLTFSLIFEHFPNANDSAKVIGISKAFCTAYGAGIAIVAGIICVQSWRTAQYLNGISILAFVIVLLFLPKKASEGSMENVEAVEDKPYVIDGKPDKNRIVFTLIEAFLVNGLCFMFFYYFALYVAERGIGTAALAGVISSVLTIGSVVGSLLIQKVFSKMQRYTGIFGGMMCAIFFILLGLNIPAWLVLIIAAFNGVAIGIVVCYYPLAVNRYVPSTKTSFYQSIYTSTIYSAFFLLSYIPGLYISIFGGGHQKVMFINGFVILVVGLVIIYFIKSLVNKKPNSL